jgi:hypothetical protein
MREVGLTARVVRHHMVREVFLGRRHDKSQHRRRTH